MTIKKLTKTKSKSVASGNAGLTRLVSAFVGATVQRLTSQYGVDYLFSLGEEPVYSEDMADPDCLLPVLAWHANTLHKQSLGFPMGLLVLDNQNGMFSKRVDFDGSNITTSTLLLFMTEAIFDLRDNLPLCNVVPNAISLDSIVSSFHRAMRERKIATEKAMKEAQSPEHSYANT